MQAALIGGYRCAMSMPHRDPTKGRSASDEVLAACCKLGMATRLALARLRLLGPVLVHGPQAILVLFDYLLARNCGWPSLVLAGLDFVHLHWGEGSHGTGVPALSAWAAFIRSCPDLWLQGLARVERRATAVRQCMSTIACVASGGALLMACFTRAVLTYPRVLPRLRLSAASCATSVCVPLPLLALGEHIGRGYMAPDTLPEPPEPWRLAPPAMAVAWSSAPVRVCCGTSCTLSLLVWIHMQPSSSRVMMPRLRQRSWRIAWSLVPCVRQESMTGLP